MATSLVVLPLPVFHFSFCALYALDVAKPHSTIQTLPSEGLQLPAFNQFTWKSLGTATSQHLNISV